MGNIYCNKCNFEWKPTETDFQTIKLNEQDDVKMRFFQCPECGEEYIIDVTDKEIREQISILKRMKKKYIRMFNVHASTTRLRRYGEKLERVQKEILEKERILRRRWTNAE